MEYYNPKCADLFGSKNYIFIAFDLYNVAEKKYLKYSNAIALFEKFGLPFLPILKINYKTINYLYNIVETYPSAFSKKFVEGFVIKKNDHEICYTRNIFKIVRKEFCTSNDNLLNKEKIKSYINFNRFISAYSKIGDNLKEIKEEMIRDILQDMMRVINDEVKENVEENITKFQAKFEKYQERMEKQRI